MLAFSEEVLNEKKILQEALRFVFLDVILSTGTQNIIWQSLQSRNDSGAL